MPRCAFIVSTVLCSQVLVGCPVDTFNSQLRMKNVADFEIQTFVSVAYPDSSLAGC